MMTVWFFNKMAAQIEFFFSWNQFHERNAKIFLRIRKEKEVFHKRHTQIHYYPSLFILIVVVIILVFYVLFTIYVFDQYSFVKEKKYVVFSNAIQYAQYAVETTYWIRYETYVLHFYVDLGFCTIQIKFKFILGSP